MKNILVTGANGYLGGWVVKELREAGHRLNLMDSHGGMIGVLAFPPEAVEVVVHLGWYAPQTNTKKEPHHHSLVRTKALAEIMYRYQPQFIFASTSAVYGKCDDMSCNEAKTKLAPNCYYSQSKALAEKEIATIIRRHMLFRFGVLIGKGVYRTELDTPINRFILDAHTSKRIEVTSPDSWIPFLHVRDAALLIKTAVERKWIGVANACQGNMSEIGIADRIAEVTQANVVKGIYEGEIKSCRMNGYRLRRFMPRDLIMKTLPETVREFAGYVKGDMDTRREWEQRKLLRI